MIRVATTDLSKALTIAAPLSGGGSTLPIAHHAHLAYRGGRLVLTTTNIEAWLQVEMPAEDTKVAQSELGSSAQSSGPSLDIDEPTPSPKSLGGQESSLGAEGTCITSKQLAALVSTLQATDTAIERHTGSNKATLSSGRVKASLLTLPGEDFPLLAGGARSAEIVLPADVLTAALQSALGFTTTDPTRPVLHGVLLEGLPRELRIVATDTHSLFRRKLQGAALRECEALGQRIVPGAMVGHLLRIIKATRAQQVHLSILSPETGTESLVARIEGDTPVTLTLRLIEGTYPHYERVIPPSYERQWTLDRKDMLAALGRVAIAAADNAGRTVLETGERGTTIVVTGESGTVGAISDEIEVGAAGAPMAIAANNKFLRRALDAMDGDGVTLQLTEPLRPIVIRPTDSPQPDGLQIDTLAIVMPMQVV